MISEEQVLHGPGRTGPDFIYDESLQRKLLKSLGLRESAPNIRGWTTLERIPPKPMFPNVRETVTVNGEEIVVYDPYSSRRKNGYGPAEKAVTEREQAKVAQHFQDMIRKVPRA